MLKFLRRSSDSLGSINSSIGSPGFRSSALLCVHMRELTLFLMKTFSIIQLNEVAVMISKSNPKKKKLDSIAIKLVTFFFFS